MYIHAYLYIHVYYYMYIHVCIQTGVHYTFCVYSDGPKKWPLINYSWMKVNFCRNC